MGKQYPLKAVRTLGEKKEEVEEDVNYSLETEPTWDHKALSGTDSVLCARCKSVLREAPENQKRDSSKLIISSIRGLYIP